MTYYEIHRMSLEGHSVSQISNHLGLNWRTVKKYLSMSEQEYEEFLIKGSEKKKLLSPYEDFVRTRLEVFRDTPAAQMHDWLKEYDANFPRVSPKTVFNFMQWVRTKHNLPHIALYRQYEMIEELPYGKQAQVDFGEYNMRSSTGHRVKVFFFTMILSRSRFKYVWFTDRYFTSELAIIAHEKAFEYIGGVPDEIVYDQDKVFIVSENGGDIILTAGFRSYTRDQSFTLHFCRKADPQSKGKVENVVKYVKQNFLYNRTYYNIETLNDEVLGWMGRTANMMPHGITKKEPYQEKIIEQAFLKPYVPQTIKPSPAMEVPDVMRAYGGQYLQAYGDRMPAIHRKAIGDITACRTPAMGGATYYCPDCDRWQYSYHCCGNRNCNKCGTERAQQWLEKTGTLLLPTEHFMVTFTLPGDLRRVARSHQRLFYGLLMRCAAEAIQTLGWDPRFVGGQLAMMGVLHTWSRDLNYHPHVHMIVAGGGLWADEGVWLGARHDFLVPVKALSVIFTAKFRDGLKKQAPELFGEVDPSVWCGSWVVHSHTVGLACLHHSPAKRLTVSTSFPDPSRKMMYVCQPDGLVNYRYIPYLPSIFGALIRHNQELRFIF